MSLFFKKYINGSKGVISLFLAILMVPFVTIAGALINAGRINSAVAIFDEALCNASNSALGTYDAFIRSRFALMAISQDVSSGGTEYGATSANYSADDLINDLFCKYMQENLGSLSNTYDSVTMGAVGLYPLSDPSVLKMSVLQASKFTVPAKMVIDWGSIDDMLNKLTKPLSLVSSIESTLTSGANAVKSLDALTDKQTALETQIAACNTVRTEYIDAYNAFADAVQKYNKLIDNISSTESSITSWQQTVDEMNAKVADINSTISSKQSEIESLRNDKSANHTEEIKKLQKEITELEEQREERVPGYGEAVKNLETAKSNLETYKSQLPGKRTAIRNTKSTYYDKIVALRDEVNKTSSAAVAFQGAASDLVNAGVSLVTDMVSTGLEIGRESIDKQKGNLAEENEYYSYQKKLAEDAGDTEAATYYYNLLQENQSINLNLDSSTLTNSNIDKLQKEAGSAVKTVSTELTNFANRDLTGEYKIIYDALEALRLKVHQRVVPEDQKKMVYNDCYYAVVNPVEYADVGTIVQNIEDQIVENGGWAVLKAIVGFMKALLKITINYDPELNSTINTSLYSANGGLPSKIKRSQYPLTSVYESEDAALSKEYKELLNSYSNGDVYDMEDNSTSAIMEMMGYIETLQELIDPFKLKNLSDMWDAAKGLVSSMKKLDFGSVVQTGASMLGQHALLVGYISYNTANRVTHEGKALTGASFDLPSADAAGGYVFSGAETEYIFNGEMSEVENQKAAFTAIWIERLLFDIAPVLADATIQTIAATIGSVTFGIGTVVTYVLCIAAEGLIDAVILGNGGDVPIIKPYAYLSPTGIPKLLEKVLTLQLSDALKKSVYEQASDCAYSLNKGVQDAALEHGKYIGEDAVELPRYDDYKSEQKELDSKFSNIFTLDYTKSLQLIMLLTCTTNKLVKRLADIIQMEASYKASQGAATYNFNLDKSYTYIRASGSFASSVFIRIGEDESSSSTNRVIYNGY